MTGFRVRDLAPAAARAALRDHPTLPRAVQDIAAATHLPPEAVQLRLEESVFDLLDVLGTSYVREMSGTVGRMLELRERVHSIYERILTGGDPVADNALLRSTFEELHSAVNELADPETWAKRKAGSGAVDPLPPEPSAPPAPAGPAGPSEPPGPPKPPLSRYPGARSGQGPWPSRAPRAGTSIPGTGQKWRHRSVSLDEIRPAIDPAGGEQYWRFPELNDGEVLTFPEAGYRVWREPGTRAVIEENLVGASQSDLRDQTRGEDALFTAGEMGQRHTDAATQRAHGAGSPGLGFDAPYGVVHAPHAVNLSFENGGIEHWVRELRDNAPPGVEYHYQTKTYSSRLNLRERVYKIGAVVDGKLHDLYEFTLRMKDGGIGDDAVELVVDEVTVYPAAEAFTAPLIEPISAKAGRPTRVEPPPSLRAALERAGVSRDRPNVSLSRTLESLGSLRETVSGKLEVRVKGEPMSPGGPRVTLDPALVRSHAEWLAATGELTEAMGSLEAQLGSVPIDPGELAALDQAVRAFRNRASRWPDQVTLEQVQAVTRLLKDHIR